MGRLAAQSPDRPVDVESNASYSLDSDDMVPTHPVHDVSYVPSYPVKTTCSGLMHGGGQGGASAMLVLTTPTDDAVTRPPEDPIHPPIAFSAGLPGGIQLAHLLDP